MVRTLHSAPAVVEVLDVELEPVAEPDVPDELDVVPAVDVVVLTVVVVVEGSVVGVESTTEEVVAKGATATGFSPTWESASPTICQVKAVVKTRAAIQAAAIRQLIMS